MPTVAETLRIAVQLHQAGNLQAAEPLYRQLLAMFPNHADAWHLLGVVALQSGNAEQAIECINRAIAIKPDVAFYHRNLATAWRIRGNQGEAIACLQRCLALTPQDLALLQELGALYLTSGDSSAAIACFQRMIELQPTSAEAYNNLGLSQLQAGQLTEARESFEHALTLQNAAEVRMNLARTLHERGDFPAALVQYQRSLELDANSALTHTHYAYTLLTLGDLPAGWREYEWRWQTPEFAPLFTPREQRPEAFMNLAEKTLFLFPEQGIGDEIMFASCLPEIAARVKRCAVACEPRLVPLYARSFPNVEIIDKNTLPRHAAALREHLQEYELKLPLASLPRYLRGSWQDFPAQQAFLQSDSLAVEYWKTQLAKLPAGLKVGISWKGGAKAADRLNRSTTLHDWRTLLQLPGVQFVNLQYGDCREELRELHSQSGITVHQFEDSNPMQNMDQFAALISALDLVISIDNSTVHLAGALGVPTWVALHSVPSWRWMLEREDTPWYPSLKLFRQSTRGEWNAVFLRLQAALREKIRA